VLGQVADTAKARDLFERGGESWKAKNYEQAISFFDKAINIYEAAESWDDCAQVLQTAAMRLIYMAKYEQAERYLNRSLQVCTQKKFAKSEAQTHETYNKIAYLYFQQRDYQRALFFFLKALGLQKKLYGETHPSIAASYNNIGVIYGYQRDLEKQQLYLQKALDLRLKLIEKDPGNKEMLDLVASTYNNLAHLYRQQKNYDKQLEYLQKALAIWIPLKGEIHEKIARTYQGIGTYYERVGNPVKEVEYLKKSVAIREQLFGEEAIGLYHSYDNLGWCYYRQGAKDEALALFNKSLSLRVERMGEYHPDVSSSYRNLASFYMKERQWQKSLEFAQRAFFGLVTGFDDKNPMTNPVPKGIDLSLPLLETFQLKANILEQMSKALPGKQAERKFAFETYSMALNLLDSIRYGNTLSAGSKGELTKASLPTFESAINLANELFMETGDAAYIEKSFLFSERCRAFQLISALLDVDARSFGGVPDSVLAMEKSYKTESEVWEKKVFELKRSQSQAEVQKAEDSLFVAKNKYYDLLNLIQEKYPKYYALKYDKSIVDIGKFKQYLQRKDALFIEYFVGDSSLFVFAIDGKDIKLHKIDQLDQILADADSLRSYLLDAAAFMDKPLDNYKALTKQSRLLFQTILEPILAPQKGNYKRLIISPDASLGYLPFEIFLTSDKIADKLNYYELPYLLRQYPISYTYSATLGMLATQQKRKRSVEVLAFAPSYQQPVASANRSKDEDLNSLAGNSNLPGALKEVQAMSKYFKGKFFYGDEATKTNFIQRCGDYGIIHLAMHGNSNDQNPMFSTLAFASDSLSEGTIYAYELPGLDLHAELVVLSACETGTGKYEKGEGIMSLARGFMHAGTPSIVMTLWKVNDASSAKLMENFYKNLDDGLAKDIALQQAKLAFLERADQLTSHPYYWAGFVALGDIKPIGQSSTLPYLLGFGALALGAGGYWVYRKRAA
jgi:CHAT domain-containing protein/tetratricopeptide (TPR) repeat protein